MKQAWSLSDLLQSDLSPLIVAKALRSPYKLNISMTDYSIFPKINATLNGSSAVLLVTGRALIARGKMAAHRAVMLTALATSSLFLVSYLYYHYHVGTVHFRGTGWTRPALLHHSDLAHHPGRRHRTDGDHYADPRIA